MKLTPLKQAEINSLDWTEHIFNVANPNTFRLKGASQQGNGFENVKCEI